MPGSARNHACACGSGRKTKRCCGEQRGPSEDQLARAHVSQLARGAVHELEGLSDRTLARLEEEILELPALDISLLVTLPRLIGPDLSRLCVAIEHDDADWGWDAVTAVQHHVDTPQQRARLADAVVRLRDENRIGRRLAAFALLNLHSTSIRFVAASFVEALSVHAGIKRTPGGLEIAA